MPARRPRSASGIDWFHIVVLHSPLTMSAPPATPSPPTANGSDLAKPKPMIPSPHIPADNATMRPWRRTRRAHPLVRVTNSEVRGFLSVTRDLTEQSAQRRRDLQLSHVRALTDCTDVDGAADLILELTT